MERENTNRNLNNFVELHLDKIKVIERISIAIFLLGIILFVLKQPYSFYILLIGAFLFAICNFLYAFSVIEPENIETTGVLNSIGFINFIYKLTYLSISISAISILELFSKFKAGQMFYVAGLTLIFILIISIITKINDRSKIYNTAFYMKIVICLLLLGYLFVIKNNLL
jgi:hypothetical protein